jgi:hypothetical protein
MRLPEGEKSPFASAIRTSDPVQIDLNVSSRTALVDGLRQAFCPFPNELSFENNLGSITKNKNRGS